MLFLYVIFIDKQFILEIIIVFVKISNNEFFYKGIFDNLLYLFRH